MSRVTRYKTFWPSGLDPGAGKLAPAGLATTSGRPRQNRMIARDEAVDRVSAVASSCTEPAGGPIVVPFLLLISAAAAAKVVTLAPAGMRIHLGPTFTTTTAEGPLKSYRVAAPGPLATTTDSLGLAKPRLHTSFPFGSFWVHVESPGMRRLGTLGLRMTGFGLSGLGLSGMGLSGLGMSGMGLSGLGMSGLGLSGLGLSGLGLSCLGLSGLEPSGLGLPGLELS